MDINPIGLFYVLWLIKTDIQLSFIKKTHSYVCYKPLRKMIFNKKQLKF